MTDFVRSGQRAANALRPVRITRGYTMHAEGSVLIEFGATRVLCTASVQEKVPPHKKGSGEGSNRLVPPLRKEKDETADDEQLM